MEKENVIRILVVDDEDDLCEILKFNLETEGYAVDTASSGEEALERVASTDYQLILLDVMMGGMSGFAVARRLRDDDRTSHIPIIFLTAKGTESDKVTGFNLGADDYISKPFSIREVMLRIRAVLRRTASSQPQQTGEQLRFKGLVVDLDRKMVTVDGQEVPFTKTELGILCTLLEQPRRVFSRHDLIRRIWPTDVLVSDRTVDVNITRVRKKLGPYAEYLTTRLGFGYYFDA